MLVDPFGDRLAGGDSPKPGQARVNFLVEVCDPSEGAKYAYSVNGILVSDFYTPNFFDPVANPASRYSFTGALKGPRQILPSGYLSWVDLATNDWWQQIWFGTPKPTFRNLGKLTSAKSLRNQFDTFTGGETAKAIAQGRVSATAAASPPRLEPRAAATPGPECFTPA